MEGLVIRGGTDVMVLNTVSLHGCLCGRWVRSSWTAKTTVVAPVGQAQVNLTDRGLQRHRIVYIREMDKDELRQAREGSRP